MAHTVVNVGDPVLYDAWLCGWMTARVLDLVTVPDAIPGRLRTDARVKITATKPHAAYRTGEIITARSRDVLPRTGWNRGSNGGTRYHLPGFCHAWESCEPCGRTVIPQWGVPGHPTVTVVRQDIGHVCVIGAANSQSAWEHAEREGFSVRLSAQTGTAEYTLTLDPPTA